jgi:hypothetical protein
MTNSTPARAQRSPSRAKYSAVIIEHQLPHLSRRPGRQLLVIQDLCQPGTRSVTNAIDDILHELRERHAAPLPDLLIYCDTRRIWDGIDHAGGEFTDFYSLNETDYESAVTKAVARAESSALSQKPSPSCEPR